MGVESLSDICAKCAEFALANGIPEFILGGLFGVLLTVGIFILLFFILAFYIYSSLAWETIARKLRYKNSWLAWIPIVRTAMILQLGRFHWAWIFLILIPVLGWIALFILSIIAIWRIYELRNYSGWFSLALVVPKVGFIIHMFFIGLVAWRDKTNKRKTPRRKPARTPRRKPARRKRR